MTPKQILDSFSQTLLHDDRVLSTQERALLTAIVHHANVASIGNQQTQDAVRAVIASSVGEIVAQRAFAVLGGSIVEQILQEGGSLSSLERAHMSTEYLGPKDPQPPTSPGPRPAPLAPSGPQTPTEPLTIPMPPSPGPQPPHAVTNTEVSLTKTAVADRSATLQANCVVLDEFLAPQELEELTRFTLDHESEFQVSEVISPHSEGGVVNYEHRSSRVLMNAGKHQQVLIQRIKTVLPEVLQKLGMDDFSIAEVEAQITASNDRDFFNCHSDNSSNRVTPRHLTFVYFFHREPRGFEGGELRIHDARLEHGHYESEGSYQTIVPRQNQIVLFPCELLHEITPVKCSSKLFADSRFTLNGWLRH